MRYSRFMEREYKQTKTTISFIKYHFVFCPRYRRKIFKITGLEERFASLTRDECDKGGIDILSLECGSDMFISV